MEMARQSIKVDANTRIALVFTGEKTIGSRCSERATEVDCLLPVGRGESGAFEHRAEALFRVACRLMVAIRCAMRHPRRDVGRGRERAAPAIDPFDHLVSIEITMKERVPERLQAVDTRLRAQRGTVSSNCAGGIDNLAESIANLIQKPGSARHRIKKVCIRTGRAWLPNDDNVEVAALHVEHLRSARAQRLDDRLPLSGICGIRNR